MATNHRQRAASLREISTFDEEVIEQQTLQIVVLVVCCSDIAQEHALLAISLEPGIQSNLSHLDDATTTPHLCNAGVV
jgi:hypothetical protein